MENNFEIDNVTSVDEAIKKMEKESYDAVVSDYEMPQKNGLEFLKELREKSNQIPFILLTGKGREDVAVKALNLGADSYINKNGSPETVYCELADAINKTVERKKSRELLAKSESKYHALVENSLQGIAILQTAPIRIVFANGALGKILGYKSEELTSLSPEGIMGLVHHEDRAVFFKRMANRLLGEPAEACFEFRAVRKDGSLIWLSSLANRVDFGGQPAVQGMFLDINESKKSEEAVRKSELRYRELANFLPEIVFETDLSGKITFFSQTAFELTGFTPEELEKGINMLQFVVPEDRERAKENIRRRMAGEKTDTSEYTLFRKNGDTYPAIVKTAPIFSETRLNGLRGLVIDITDRKKAEEELRASQHLNEKILNSTPNLIYIYDLIEHRNVYANREILNFLGYTSEQVQAMRPELFTYILHPDDAKAVAEHHARFANAPNDAVYEVKYRMKHSSGEWRWLRSRDVLFARTKEGLGKQILGSTEDITERKKAEEALIESDVTQRSLINGMSDAVWVVDFNGKFVDVNNAAVKDLGYSRDELLSIAIKDVDKCLTPEQANVIMSRVASVGTQSFETVHTAKDGTEIPVEIISSLITYRGKPAVLGIARNISERKKAELELKQYSEVLERIGESIDAGLAVINKDYRVVWANKRLMDLSVAPNKKCYETFNNIGIICPDCGVERIFQNNAQRDVHEYKTVNSKGETVWVELRVTPLKDQNGVTMAALELAIPLTERKIAEEALRKSEEEYSCLFANMIDGFAYCKMIFDENNKPVDFVYLQINDAFERITGLKRGMVLGKNVTQAIPGIIEANPELFEIYGRVALTGKEETFEVFFKPLSLWLNISVYSPQNGYFAAVFEDITERKNLEQRSAAERTLVNGVINSANSLIFSVDRNYCYTSFNNAHALGMKTIFGVDIQIGKNLLNYMSVDIDREKAKINIDKALAGEQLVEESFSGDEKFSRNYFIISHSPIKNAEGEVTGVVIVSNDITEHKKAEEELKRNQAKLEIMNEKLNVVGRLTRHDVGNKLMVMKSNIYLLNKKIGDTPELVKHLKGIVSAINQSDEMFEFSRFYEKIGVENPSEIDVAQCFNQAVALLPTLGTIKIINDCQGLEVKADSLLKQLFYNLVDNSLKYGEKVTQIRLHFTTDVDVVKLSYEDNGVGIPAANKPKLFREGFTTGKSTGLGLFLIKKMVEVYGWTITEEGEPDKGAKFVITIPKINL